MYIYCDAVVFQWRVFFPKVLKKGCLMLYVVYENEMTGFQYHIYGFY
jgi:hypothetical protein